MTIVLSLHGDQAVKDGVLRLSINRTQLGENGRWLDGITWDDIQGIKSQLGFSEYCAVEIFPPRGDLVDVANVKHIWVLKEPPPFMWRRSTPPIDTGSEG